MTELLLAVLFAVPVAAHEDMQCPRSDNNARLFVVPDGKVFVCVDVGERLGSSWTSRCLPVDPSKFINCWETDKNVSCWTGRAAKSDEQTN